MSEHDIFKVVCDWCGIDVWYNTNYVSRDEALRGHKLRRGQPWIDLHHDEWKQKNINEKFIEVMTG